MKARKIVMSISLLLFVLGISCAIFFTFSNRFAEEWVGLLTNMAIGLATGGLVAFLIEIPISLSYMSHHKRVLQSNGFHAFMKSTYLIAIIEETCKSEDMIVPKKHCTVYIDEMMNFLVPMQGFDTHIYVNGIKRRKANLFLDKIGVFVRNRDILEGEMQMKISNNTSVPPELHYCEPWLESKELKSELANIKSVIKGLHDAITDIMETVLNERELGIWRYQISVMNKEMDSFRARFNSIHQRRDK